MLYVPRQVLIVLAIIGCSPIAVAQERFGNASSAPGPASSSFRSAQDFGIDLETELKIDPGYKSSPLKPGSKVWVDAGEMKYRTPGTLKDEYIPGNTYSGIRLRLPFEQ
jgi:hypothetical protein